MKVTKPKITSANLITSNYDYLSNYVTTDQLQKAIQAYNAAPKEAITVDTLDVNGNYDLGTAGKNNYFKSNCANNYFYGTTNCYAPLNVTNLNISGTVNGNDINKISYLSDVNYNVHDAITMLDNMNNAQTQNLSTINSRLNTNDSKLTSNQNSINSLTTTTNQLSANKADLSYVQNIDNQLQSNINTKVDNTTFSDFQVQTSNNLNNLQAIKADLSYVNQVDTELQTNIDKKVDILDFSATVQDIQDHMDVINLITVKNDDFQVAKQNIDIAINNVAFQLTDYMTSNNMQVNNLSNNKLNKSLYDVDQANIQTMLTNLSNTKSDISYVDQKFTDLMGGMVPSTLDTIREISAALQNDSNSINSIFTTLGTKVNQSDYDNYVSLNDYNITDLRNTKANTSYVNTINTTLQNAKLDKTTFNSYKALNDSTVAALQTDKLSNTDFSVEKQALIDTISTKVSQSSYDIDKQTTTSSLSNLQTVKADKSYVDTLNTNTQAILDTKVSQSTYDSKTSVIDSALSNLDTTKASKTYVDNVKSNIETSLATTNDNVNVLFQTATIMQADISNCVPIQTYTQDKTDKENAISNLQTYKLDASTYNTYVSNNDIAVNNLQSIKANTEYVDTQVNNLQSSINLKADRTYTDNSLSLKADKLEVTNSLNNLQSSINSSLATKANISYVDSSIANLVNSAPEALNTLNELSQALNNDPSFATSIATTIGTKADKIYVDTQDSTLQSNINLKADKSYTDSALSLKADKTYVDSQDNVLQGSITSLQNNKADKSYVDSQDTTLQANINLKADKTYVDSGLGVKADKTYVDTQDSSLQSNINLKADITYVDSQLGLKSDKTYVDGEFSLKANKTYVDAQDSTLQSNINTLQQNKADTTYVDAQLLLKASKTDVASDVASLQNAINALSNTKASITYVDSAVANIVNSAPEALNTLQELSAALGNDPNFASTIAITVGNKADKSYVDSQDSVQQLQINSKADKTYVDDALSSTATKTYVDNADNTLQSNINLKADKTYVDSEFSLKANKTYVDTQDSNLQTAINLKADKTYVDSELSGKANKTYVDNELLSKADKTYVDTAVSNVINAAPETLNTLNELASALGNDANFATSVTTSIGNKADKTYVDSQDLLLSGRITTLESDPVTKTYVDTAISNISTTNNNNGGSSTVDISGKADKTYVDTQDSLLSGRITTLENSSFASTSYVSTAISNLVNSAPETLNTLNELATALGNDPAFATTVTSSIANKAVDADVVHLANAETMTGLKTFSAGLTVSGGTITLPNNSIATSAINNSYLQYLDATSSVQTQLNAKATDTAVVHLDTAETITGTKTFNNYQIVERMAEQVHSAGSGTSLSLSYSSIKGIIYYSPSANFTLTLTNVPTTSTTMTYTLTLVYNTKFYCNAISINSTSYTMRAANGLANITIDTNALTVIQQINIMFLNSATPIVTTNVLSLY